ncbi:hypothetical protein ACQY0O_005881 [Thecaphora frezii]
MVAIKVSVLVAAAALVSTAQAQNKPTFKINALPDKWEAGQVGSNQCKQWGESSPNSMCQNVFVNSADDFCLFAPYVPGSTIGNEEERTIAYCTSSGYGTRVFPRGTIRGAQFLKTPDYIQVTGYGDFTKIGIQAGDQGGELDPHGATGAGNPAGGLVFSRNVKGKEGRWVQIKEWNNFMSATQFSIRAAYGPHRREYAPHIYDVMGSDFNSPGKYPTQHFEDCDGDSGAWPGVYNGSTFYQGQAYTPPPQARPSSSNCLVRPSPNGDTVKQRPYKKRAHPTAQAEHI